MTEGLLSRFLAAGAMAAALLAAPALAASGSALEAEFDTMFGGPKAKVESPAVNVRRNQLPASVQPAVVPVRPAVSLVPVISSPTPSYSSPFEASIAALAEGSQGRIGVAALDLETGRSVSILGDQAFPMASTSKIAIVATFLSGVDEGRYRLYDQYPLIVPVPSKKFSSTQAPVRQGTMMSAQSLIEAAITRSDNQATDALLAAVGGPSVVTRWVQSRTGITDFRIDRTIATLVRDDGAVNPATAIDKRDSVSPMGMVRLLTGLYRGDWLSPSSTQVLLGAMGRTVTGKHRIRGLLPEGTQVAHKTGTLFNTASDVGFIKTPDGRDLAVAIYVTGQGSKPARDARIAAIARSLYDGYLAEAASNRRTALR
ncbi:class A beta-lactamase-related serine hydrolase [Novosphingobium sp. MW5]|nr:class A beta-lactamase-related serine hydrolase [Novosphingobium sp. MW5]